MRQAASALLLLMTAGGSAAGCAAATQGPAAFPGAPAGPSRVVSHPASLTPAPVVADALSLRGVPYRLGGDTPALGLDCSGLVRHVFALHGIDLPRTVAEQFRVGRTVRTKELRPGDLVFFTTVGRGATHVGIATDVSGEFVHAPGTGASVRTDRVDAPYWRSRVVGVRRVIEVP